MNIKTSITTLVATVVCLAGFAHAQTFQQQQRFQQPGFQQPGFQQGFQQGQPIRGQVIQQPRAAQSPQYSNVTLTEEQKTQPSLGASFYDSRAGIAVRSVFSNGPAQRAGINSGDVISKANGQAVTNAATFNAMVARMNAGDTVKLTKRSSSGKVSEVACQLMTMGQIIEASTEPDAGAYDTALRQAEVSLNKLGQQIKSSQAELNDMQKRYAAQQKSVENLKVKAKAARVEAQKKKVADEARRKQQMEEMRRRAEAASKAGGSK